MANYLPVLLVSVSTNAIPDDSSVSTLPRGQVDYLSHDWQEEDVWRSWRNMTRKKNEITNGMRLENASWRTWWKQRNKLKTISPETLNWLKDSDVTWLYGPLHTAVDWTPPPKPKADPTSVDKDNSAHDRLDLSIAKKSILKYRSISELLTSDLPTPLFSPPDSSDERDSDDLREERELYNGEVFEGPGENVDGREARPVRPMLKHTKSDTHITRWGPNRAFRKDSPPRVIAVDPTGTSPTKSTPHSYSRSNSQVTLPPFSNPDNQSLSPTKAPGEDLTINGSTKKKHISFNTFVEQCIAIEKPKKVSGMWPANGKVPPYYHEYDDGYDEDEEDGYGDESLPIWGTGGSPSDSETESEDALEMRSVTKSQGRSKSSSESPDSMASTSSSNSSAQTSRYRPPLVRTSTSESKDHVTIAPIAPTILKTAGVGNNFGWRDGFGDEGGFSDDGGLGRWYSSERKRDDEMKRENDMDPAHLVELVYVPPLGSNYSVHKEEDETEIVYRSREAFFGGFPISTRERSHSPPNYFPDRNGNVATTLPAVESAFPTFDSVDDPEDDPYDFFGGPDLGEDFPGSRLRPGRRRDSISKRIENDPDRGGGNLPFAQGGASNVFGGRSTGALAPEVVVNNVNGEVERGRERSRSRSGSRSNSRSISRSRTPSPVTLSQASPTPSLPILDGRARSSSLSPPAVASLLLPPSSRGRSAIPHSASTSALESRGRSSTRTTSSSSLSDRDRSSAGSPMGGLSPDGTSGALAAVGGVYANVRVPRGRTRVGRSLSQSLSPDDGVKDTRLASRTSAAAGTSAGSFSSSSTSSSATAVPLQTDKALSEAKDTPSPPIAEKVQEGKPRRPTHSRSPSNSRYVAPTPVTPSPPALSEASSMSIELHSSTRASRSILDRDLSPSKLLNNREARGYSLAERDLEGGTIVGRAVGMVSSAGAYLGLWHGV